MKQLKNGCARSEIKVIPKNWKTVTTCRARWMVYYRFYCPGLTGKGTKYPKGRMVVDSSMNKYKTVHERQSYVITIINLMQQDLDERDFNPITDYIAEKKEEDKRDYEIHPDTPLLEAWQAAYEKRKVKGSTKIDLKSVIKYSSIAAKNMKIDCMPVKDVRKRHMKSLLDQLGKVKGDKWTANNYNHYRSNLSMLFDELCEWDAVEFNPIEKISKQEHIVKKRATLSQDQRRQISEDLRKNNYRMWLMMQIFFHSGARETEIMLVKKEDVNLKDQTVTYTILKGQSRREERPIPTNAISLWEQALVGAQKGQFLFARGLKPGGVAISPKQLSRRWKRWVKDKTNAAGEKLYGDEVADFYSLKHSHSTQVAKRVGTKLAAMHNRHTEAVLKKNYDVDGSDREMEILKNTEIDFEF